MPHLIEDLQSKYHSYDFFQSVSLVKEFLHTQKQDSDPLGSGRIMFCPEVSLTFPPSDIVKIDYIDDEIVRYVLSFMGLVGIASPLPHYFSEECLLEDTALLDFLTIFNHRIYTLFFQAWEKHRIIFRSIHKDCHGLYEKLALLGSLSEKTVSHWKQMLGFLGIFTTATRSAEGLRTVLSNYFDDIAVQIIQWVGRWAPISNPSAVGLDAKLGINTVIGTHIWDVSGKFRVVIGPMKRELFESFLPGTKKCKILRSLIMNYLTDPLAFDIELQLEPTALSPVILGLNQAVLGITSSCGISSNTAEVYSLLIE